MQSELKICCLLLRLRSLRQRAARPWSIPHSTVAGRSVLDTCRRLALADSDIREKVPCMSYTAAVALSPDRCSYAMNRRQAAFA